jgi:hypothetical protein
VPPLRLSLIALILSGCALPPPLPPPTQPPPVGFNLEPWVGSQIPSGPYVTAGTHQMFQTPNSLPLGAATTPPF